jgi:hypothetical protein
VLRLNCERRPGREREAVPTPPHRVKVFPGCFEFREQPRMTQRQTLECSLRTLQKGCGFVMKRFACRNLPHAADDLIRGATRVPIRVKAVIADLC